MGIDISRPEPVPLPLVRTPPLSLSPRKRRNTALPTPPSKRWRTNSPLSQRPHVGSGTPLKMIPTAPPTLSPTPPLSRTPALNPVVNLRLGPPLSPQPSATPRNNPSPRRPVDVEPPHEVKSVPHYVPRLKSLSLYNHHGHGQGRGGKSGASPSRNTAHAEPTSTTIPTLTPFDPEGRFIVDNHSADPYIAVHAAQRAIQCPEGFFKMSVAMDASFANHGGASGGSGGVGVVFFHAEYRPHIGHAWSFAQVPNDSALMELAAIAHGVHLAGERLAEALRKAGLDRATHYQQIEVNVFSDCLYMVNLVNGSAEIARRGTSTLADDDGRQWMHLDDRPLRNKILNFIVEDIDAILDRASNIKVRLNWIKGHMFDFPVTTSHMVHANDMVWAHERADFWAKRSRRRDKSFVACWESYIARRTGDRPGQADMPVWWRREGRSWLYLALKDDWH